MKKLINVLVKSILVFFSLFVTYLLIFENYGFEAKICLGYLLIVSLFALYILFNLYKYLDVEDLDFFGEEEKWDNYTDETNK